MNPTFSIFRSNSLLHNRYINRIPRQKVITVVASCRYYSTSKLDSESFDLPVPILTFDKLNDEDIIKSYRGLLKDKGVFIVLLTQLMVIDILEAPKIFI